MDAWQNHRCGNHDESGRTSATAASMAICCELLRGWKRAFLLGARRIKLGAVEAARTRRPRGLASTVPHPAPPTGEDSNSLFPPSVFVRGFSYLGLRFRRPVWIAQNGSRGGPGKSVQIKGRSPRLVVGSSTMAQIPCWVARARRRKKHHWWSPKHNEWRDLELPFVKTSDKMRKGCLVAAGQPIVVPATDGAGVCVVRTATRSAEGSVLESTQYAVACTIAVPCFRAGICITDEFIIRPRTCQWLSKSPKAQAARTCNVRHTYTDRQSAIVESAREDVQCLTSQSLG